MLIIISNADFPASNYLRFDIGSIGDHHPLSGKKMHHGGFTIRIDDSIELPDDKMQLQKLVNELIAEVCEARKNRNQPVKVYSSLDRPFHHPSGNPEERINESLKALHHKLKDAWIEREIDPYDPSQTSQF